VLKGQQSSVRAMLFRTRAKSELIPTLRATMVSEIGEHKAASIQLGPNPGPTKRGGQEPQKGVVGAGIPQHERDNEPMTRPVLVVQRVVEELPLLKSAPKVGLWWTWRLTVSQWATRENSRQWRRGCVDGLVGMG
jgi:hypothetical protein